LAISGDAARYDHHEGNDDYTQAGNLFRLFDDAHRRRFFANVAASMAGVPEEIIERQLAHFEKVDPACARGIRAALSES
jgi:catalase